MTDLYNLRPTKEPGAFIITKFDDHMNVESSYLVTHSDCACPRGHAPKCRHRTMLPLFIKTNHINDGWFLNFDTRQWHPPVMDDIDASAPAVDEPEVTALPLEASEVPTPPSSSKSVAGAPSTPNLFVRPL